MCLDLNPYRLYLFPHHSDKIEKELNLIDATHILTTSSRGRLDIMPIQIRLEPDRLVFVGQFMRQNLELLHDMQFLERFAKKLCKNTDSETTFITRLHAAALKCAVDNGVFDVVTFLAKKVIGTLNEKLEREIRDNCLESLFGAVKCQSLQIDTKKEVIHLLLPLCEPFDLSWLLEILESLDDGSNKLESPRLVEELRSQASRKIVPSEPDIQLEAFYGASIGNETLSASCLRKLSQLELCLRTDQAYKDMLLWDETVIDVSLELHSQNPSLSLGFLLNLHDVRKSIYLNIKFTKQYYRCLKQRFSLIN